MVAANSRLSRALGSGAQTPEADRGAFDSLARQSDDVEFAVSLSRWVVENHRPMIARLDGPVGKGLPSGLADDLKAQLASARSILKQAANQPEALGNPEATGSLGAGNAKGQSD